MRGLLRVLFMFLLVGTSGLAGVGFGGPAPALAAAGDSVAGSGTLDYGYPACDQDLSFEVSATGSGTGVAATGTFSVTCPASADPTDIGAVELGWSVAGPVDCLATRGHNDPQYGRHKAAIMGGLVTASTTTAYPVGTDMVIFAVDADGVFEDSFSAGQSTPAGQWGDQNDECQEHFSSGSTLSSGDIVIAHPDADDDGVKDSRDNCPATVNPGQRDTDGDGIGDACDLTPTGDTDDDGVDNADDNCPTVANANQMDTDGDGHGNACDVTPTGDTDQDGIDNARDNCPSDSNPHQRDDDRDGLGNACDSTPNGDSDNDGVDNETDNCPNVPNAGQGDSDNDGIGNACDYSAKADGRIRRGSGTFVGNNVYNTTGDNQTKSGAAMPGRFVRFGISAQNDGTGPDVFEVQADGSTAGYNVRYYVATEDVTAAVVAGTYRTPSLAPGATHLITAKVKVLSSSAEGSQVERLVTITSTFDSSVVDVVKFVASRV